MRKHGVTTALKLLKKTLMLDFEKNNRIECHIKQWLSLVHRRALHAS